ncbi:hypothetical protein [Motilimonas pumila]|uniref:Tetratricopeptide repeat protein n=1 Tax=Motilimonas pumila TaxID=2303987 RepID=A0A418YHK1_9GAMM|nr:hypothetical protein [Motilimonas pumila]RJG49533.1 hypothetical protein D1Z90_06130 [Motilimonas pumila]
MEIKRTYRFEDADLAQALAAVDNIITERPVDALEKVTQIVNQVRSTNHDHGYVQALLKMAEVYWHTMDYHAGLKVCRRVESLLTIELEFEFCPELYHRYASLNWGLARYRSAQHYWNQCLEKSILSNQFKFQIEALVGLGNVWRITDSLHDAESALKFALELAVYCQFEWLGGKAAILLSWTLFLQQRFTDMLPYLDRGSKLLQDCTDQTWHAEIHDFRGLALLYSGDVEAAKSEVNLALNIATEHELKWMSAHASISLSKVAKETGELEAANQYLQQAETMALEFDEGELLSQICLERANICERLGVYLDALNHYQRYRNYSVNLLREQSASKGRDQYLSSRGQLDARSQRLIRRLNITDHVAQIEHLPQFRLPQSWLHLVQLRRDQVDWAIVRVTFSEPSATHFGLHVLYALLQPDDRITQWQQNQLLLTVQVAPDKHQKLLRHIQDLLSSYPWWLQGIEGCSVKAELCLFDELQQWEVQR